MGSSWDHKRTPRGVTFRKKHPSPTEVVGLALFGCASVLTLFVIGGAVWGWLVMIVAGSLSTYTDVPAISFLQAFPIGIFLAMLVSAVKGSK